MKNVAYRSPTHAELYALDKRARLSDQFITPFWRKAFESLPLEIRERHVLQMQNAERWELALGGVLKTVSQLRNAVAKLFSTPRSAHR